MKSVQQTVQLLKLPLFVFHLLSLELSFAFFVTVVRPTSRPMLEEGWKTECRNLQGVVCKVLRRV